MDASSTGTKREEVFTASGSGAANVSYAAEFRLLSPAAVNFTSSTRWGNVFVTQNGSRIFAGGGGGFVGVWQPGTYSVSINSSISSSFAGPQPLPINESAGLSLSLTAVPVPAAAWLFGSALLGLGVVKRRRG